MKNKTKILLISAFAGLLALSACQGESLSSALLSSSEGSASSSQSSSSETKEESPIKGQKELSDALNALLSKEVGALTYHYQERMPNAAKDEWTIDVLFDASFNSQESLLKRTEEGAKTERRYAGIENDVYYAMDVDTEWPSAKRYKVVEDPSDNYTQITKENAQKEIDAFRTTRYGLPYLLSNGQVGDTGKPLNFLGAASEQNVLLSFSSDVDAGGNYKVLSTSYYENPAEDDYVLNYSYTLEATFAKDLSLIKGTVSAHTSAKMNWNKETHLPNENADTYLVWDLQSVSYGLPKYEKGTLLEGRDSYFISSIKEAYFSSYMDSSLRNVLRVGDSTSSLTIPEGGYAPETATDVSSIVVTGSSDETIFGPDSYGGYSALKAGTVDVTIGNAFNPNLYVIKGVEVRDQLPYVMGINGIEDGGSISLAVGAKEEHLIDNWGTDGKPYDISQMSVTSSDEATVKATLEQRLDESTSNYNIYLVLEALKAGSASISFKGGLDAYAFSATFTVTVA